MWVGGDPGRATGWGTLGDADEWGSVECGGRPSAALIRFDRPAIRIRSYPRRGAPAGARIGRGLEGQILAGARVAVWLRVHIFTHMDERFDALSRTYSGIAHPTRRALLRHLRGGPSRVTELATHFDDSLNTISKHIKQLERAGLVDREVRGRDHFLRANATGLIPASTWIEDYCAFWRLRLGNLETLLNDAAGRRR